MTNKTWVGFTKWFAVNFPDEVYDVEDEGHTMAYKAFSAAWDYKQKHCANLARNYGRTWGENIQTHLNRDASQIPSDEIANAIEASS